MRKILGFDELIFKQPYKLLGNNLPKVEKNNFFLSFSDSLKYLLNESGIKKSDTLLLPDFYCPETSQEISKYAKLVFYEIKPNLSVDKTSYFAQIRKYKPRVIINYNFTGFTLTKQEKEILKKLSWNPILIDDCAHRILEAKEISFLTRNHFYIDSIRKYSPFLGSHLIHPKLKPKNVKSISFYKIKIIALQTLLQVLGHIAIYCNSRFFDNLGEHFFNIQDSIVGFSPIATSGDSLSYQLWKKLDLTQIKARKKELALVYFQQ
ncbi:MAG: hypothetical protein KGL95_09625, partial [Patescibacteria group bacterium]|nr:hypothetical protein [Patescibacteria group bacterium]